MLDTELTDSAIKLAKGSDTLICEATYMDNLKDHAKLYKHLTAKQAAEIAKKSKSKKLILTHFSKRSHKRNILQRKRIFISVRKTKTQNN